MKAVIFFILAATLSLGLFAFSKDLQFQKKKIQVGARTVSVEIADSPEKLSRGLMYRKKIPENEGMLFIFPEESVRTFWMKNTFVPLSIGFFDAKRRLVDIQDMQPVKSELEMNPPTYQSAKPAKYALEVPQGWFQRKNIKVGDQLSGL